MQDRIVVACSTTEHVGLAYHQNSIPFVSEIVVENASDADVVDVVLTVTSHPPVVRPATFRIDRIGAGRPHRIEAPDLKLDAAALAGFTEANPLQLRVEVAASDEVTATGIADLRVLPPSHWGGGRSAPELLAAFVRPNEPVIDVVLRDAATKLEAAGRESGLNGYSGNGKSRIWEMAGAIWAALAERRIAYVLPPASFERTGQKVRGPAEVLERQVGTCLDTSLLLAAALEQAGLHPILVLTAGHALVGVWLKDDDFASAAIDDMQLLRKRRDLQDMILIETTLLTGALPAPFAAAVERGARHADEEAAAALEVAVDIHRCRLRGIRPLDLGGASPLGIAPAETATVELPLSAPPEFRDEVLHVEQVEERALDRLERWKRRLLDLTLRNKLLNFKPGKNAVVLECADAADLEDRLSAGRNFRLMPRSDVLDGSDERSRELFARRHLDDGRRRYLAEALGRDEIHTTLGPKELDDRLLDLFRLARNGFEEGGANILFLAVGFLSWTRKEGEQAYRAPLLLIPVSLKRSSVRAGFRLALHDDDARLNPTLIELLRQEFDLLMPEFTSELPRDATGLDVARILAIVRSHVRDLKGWEVLPDVVLSAFSFTKYLMWRDLVERAELLKRNPVVRHLLDTPTHSYGDGSPFPEPESLDRDYRPDAIFAPLSADSSQLSAVLAAASGKDFVLFGPPGTGKSQTIGNMIAQCLAAGRTVLFVSQKTAALEVVQRRLGEIGLAEYCLEIHSTKAQKAIVLGQLRAAWHERQSPSTAGWTEATNDLAHLRDELNGLVSALHRRRDNGMSAYEALGRVVAGGVDGQPITLEWVEDLCASPAKLAGLRRLCRDLRPVIEAAGDVSDHPLAGIEDVEWSPRWQAEIGTALDRYVEALEGLNRAARSFATSISLEPLIETYAGTRALLVLGSHLIREEARDGLAFLGTEAEALRTALAERERFGLETRRRETELKGRYEPSIYDQDLETLLAAWIDAQSANFLLRGGKTRRVRVQMGLYAIGDLPEDLGPDLRVLIGLARHLRAGCPADEVIRRSGSHWLEENVASRLLRATDWADRAIQLAELIGAMVSDDADLRAHIQELANEGGPFAEGGGARETLAQFVGAWRVASDPVAALNRLAGRGEAELPLAEGPDWFATNLALARRWSAGLDRARTWCAWQQAAAAAGKAGLSPILAAIESGAVVPNRIEDAFATAYARWWSDRLVSDDPVLRRFLPERHEDAIAQFQDLDARVTELSKRIVRSRLGGGIPGPTTFGADPEWGTLASQLVKKRNHLPLRQLFGRMPNALTKLTPCVMASPLSIAQYLPPDGAPFDVVIFDEASQIAPWDAIGAVARGRQVVIVGDPEQLPPTNVGDRGVDEIEDGTDITDQESILDECLSANIPRRNLDWHYRSRHESLIAFSNSHYYGGRLVTFPAPVTEDKAVRLVHVPDGLYERGSSNRVNRPEARAVVAEVVRRLKEPIFAAERRSLGIVTFNADQQRLIENLLDAERRAHPELEPFFDKDSCREPVFVKNLENVQGDERDVIVFSVAVGPDAAGRISTTVSSLNKQGGHRRLNVAITRARRELLVFASLRPEQIDLGRTGSRGVRDFKHFLEFADRGARALAQAAAPTGQETESPFEDAVMAGLVGRGWIVHPQVGVSGFRIDLGIVHPDEPGRYLAGVECDGATYHRSATARDRDRLREMVLTDLGWRIRRVWSTEWWSGAAAALDKLDTMLRTDLDDDRLRAEAVRSAAQVPSEAPGAGDPEVAANDAAGGAPEGASRVEAIERDEPKETIGGPLDPALSAEVPTRLYAERSVLPACDIPTAGVTAPYRLADPAACGHALDPDRFYEPSYRTVLAAAVVHVLAEEAPIFEDLLVRRIARAHNFARTGSRITQAITEVIEQDHARTEEDERTVLWPTGMAQSSILPFRPSPPGVRSHSDIPMVELAGLAQNLAARAGGQDVVRLLAAELGLSRLEAATRLRFERAIMMSAAGQSARSDDVPGGISHELGRASEFERLANLSGDKTA